MSDTIRKLEKRDIIMMMGDMNAKRGSNNERLEHVMGQYGIGEMNENGNLCASYDLVIGRSLFIHKKCHKVTRVSPDHNTENQIDHIAISRMFRRSLTNIRNSRGADIGSEHR
jgi:endonuclease/exonuclease/phosphatase family metal-dependent hydrolase